jgi:hypothetical protein
VYGEKVLRECVDMERFFVCRKVYWANRFFIFEWNMLKYLLEQWFYGEILIGSGRRKESGRPQENFCFHYSLETSLGSIKNLAVF